MVVDDERMPRLDGLELGREIAVRRLAIPACLAKPFSITDLGATVDWMLKQQSADRASLANGPST